MDIEEIIEFLPKIKNYFGVNDRTPFEHSAFIVIDNLIRLLDKENELTLNQKSNYSCLNEQDSKNRILIKDLQKQLDTIKKENERWRNKKIGVSSVLTSLNNENKRLKKQLTNHNDTDRNIVLELSDEEYIVVTKSELKDIHKSSEEFDGFLGHVEIGEIGSIIKENTQLKEKLKEYEDCLRCGLNTKEMKEKDKAEGKGKTMMYLQQREYFWKTVRELLTN